MKTQALGFASELATLVDVRIMTRAEAREFLELKDDSYKAPPVRTEVSIKDIVKESLGD